MYIYGNITPNKFQQTQRASSSPLMALQWLSLVAAIWLQAINGTNTNFPAYSSELKKILSISQLQLNNLAFASDAGKLLGWISGVAAARLPLWLVLLIGSALGLAGYGVQFVFLANREVLSLTYWQVFSLTVLAGNSICWINTVCYITVIRNFPLDRQIAIGLSTSYVGLSAKIYTDIVDVVAARNNNEYSHHKAKIFVLLNALFPLLVAILAAPIIYRDFNVEKSRKLAGGFFSLFVVTIVTGIFAVITSLLGFKLLPPIAVLAGMIVFLALPLATPLAEKVREMMLMKCSIRVYDEGMRMSNVENGEIKDGGGGGGGGGGCDEEDDGGFVDVGPKLMVMRVEFWLYFFVYLFGATLGLVYMNNLGQIAESRGCLRTSSLVSLSSAFGFFGRLLPCIVDYFLEKTKCVVSRAASMGAMMAPMCGAFFLLVISHHDASLYISTAIIGISTGAITSISVCTTTELFGAKYFGVNHNILVSNIPIGSFVFGYLAALLYKRERNGTLIAGDDGRNQNCMGQKCYQTTFIMWGCLCVLGTLLALVLHGRTRKKCGR